MDLRLIIMFLLALVVVASTVTLGALYLGKWRSDSDRMKRRMRDLDW